MPSICFSGVYMQPNGTTQRVASRRELGQILKLNRIPSVASTSCTSPISKESCFKSEGSEFSKRFRMEVPLWRFFVFFCGVEISTEKPTMSSSTKIHKIGNPQNLTWPHHTIDCTKTRREFCASITLIVRPFRGNGVSGRVPSLFEKRIQRHRAAPCQERCCSISLSRPRFFGMHEGMQMCFSRTLLPRKKIRKFCSVTRKNSCTLSSKLTEGVGQNSFHFFLPNFERDERKKYFLKFLALKENILSVDERFFF